MEENYSSPNIILDFIFKYFNIYKYIYRKKRIRKNYTSKQR